MSRSVLLAWELGAGRGHILRLAQTTRALEARGLDTIYAVQRLDTLQAASVDPTRGGHFQAPIWPGLLSTSGVGLPGLQATLGDILADLGLRNGKVVEYALAGWDTIFSHVRPSAVVADYSPMCLLAARGRIPTLATGNGFTLPPAHLERFPILRPEREDPKYDEPALLESLNGALRATSRHPIDRLPAVFTADRTCLGGFTEIDPYAADRRTSYLAPFIPSWDPDVRKEGNEIFVYLPEYIHSYPSILTALESVAAAGSTLRLYAPNLDQTIAQRLASAAVAVERQPLPLESIARRTRLIVSHGGCGTVSFALASGIPQVVIAFDTEKLLTGTALEKLQAGRLVRLQRDNPLEAALLGQVILEAHADDRLAETARSLAPGFLARLQEDPAECVADQVVEIARG
ncbi:MAG: hypothetical protein IT539_14780 [Bradyrhizobiaceae bacterium]|nr:hypothetical protein [Bradyrhizobiaceae bacterium]